MIVSSVLNLLHQPSRLGKTRKAVGVRKDEGVWRRDIPRGPRSLSSSSVQRRCVTDASSSEEKVPFRSCTQFLTFSVVKCPGSGPAVARTTFLKMALTILRQSRCVACGCYGLRVFSWRQAGRLLVWERQVGYGACDGREGSRRVVKKEGGGVMLVEDVMWKT